MKVLLQSEKVVVSSVFQPDNSKVSYVSCRTEGQQYQQSLMFATEQKLSEGQMYEVSGHADYRTKSVNGQQGVVKVKFYDLDLLFVPLKVTYAPVKGGE